MRRTLDLLLLLRGRRRCLLCVLHAVAVRRNNGFGPWLRRLEGLSKQTGLERDYQGRNHRPGRSVAHYKFVGFTVFLAKVVEAALHVLPNPLADDWQLASSHSS